MTPRASIILLISIYSAGLFAQTGKLNEQVSWFSEDIKSYNKIEYIGEHNSLNGASYIENTCETRAIQTNDSLEQHKDVQNKGKIIKYVSAITNGHGELKVNGIHILIQPSIRTVFVLAENCTKLVPIEFISGAEQKFFGINLKRGNVFKPFINKMGSLLWGQIDDDGYLRPGNTEGLGGEDSLQEMTFTQNYYKKLVQCAEIKELAHSDKGFYFFNGKRYEYSESRPNFWKAYSKYLGHRVCSDQPQAKVDCEGTPSWSSFADDSIFGITEGYLDYATSKEEEERMRQEVAEEIREAKIVGKKCDEAIAKYEKETGKKVKISPYYPARRFRNINK